jgi:hypothetical protein
MGDVKSLGTEVGEQIERVLNVFCLLFLFCLSMTGEQNLRRMLEFAG